MRMNHQAISKEKHENGVQRRRCIVQLILRGTSSLGIALYRRGRFLHVSEFMPDGEASKAAIGAMLEPQLFRQAKILAVNSVKWNDDHGAEAIMEELKRPSRSKSLLLSLPWRNGDSEPYTSVKHCVGVNRVFGDVVEFVFQEGKVAGMVASPPPPNKTNNSPLLLQVQQFLPQSEAAALSKQMLLNPDDFCGATIVAVNGRTCPTRNDAIQAIRTSPRPMSIQFQLALLPTNTHGPNKPRPFTQPRVAVTNHDSSSNGPLKANSGGKAEAEAEEEKLEFTVKAREMMRRFRNLDLGDTINNGLRQMSTSLTVSSSSSMVMTTTTTTRTNNSNCSSSNFGDKTNDIWDLDAQERRKGAYDACCKFIREHLENFVDQSPNATYEDWIKEIHPENTSMPEESSSLDELTVDYRFYVEGSVHRKIWNNHLDGGSRKFVPIRHFE